ncbi:MAG: AP protein [Isosphaeraceae bacterium]
MPFFWTVVARDGLVLGNRDRKSPARDLNPKLMAYACHNEMLTGRADPRINFNDKRPNPNVTVLEWLSRRDAYRGRVGAVGAWDVLPWILNTERSGISVNAGWQPIQGTNLSSDARLLNRMIETAVQQIDDVRDDVFTFRVAMEALPRNKPRVFFLDLGVDDYAHYGRYDLYLHGARQFDTHIKELWETLQSHPQYRDTTTMIIATDHGRGRSSRDWRNHKPDIPGSDEIWLAVLGPDTPSLGERTDTPETTLGQVAALLGELTPFREAFPQAAPPIGEAVGRDPR